MISSLDIRNNYFECMGGRLKTESTYLYVIIVYRYHGNDAEFLDNFIEITDDYKEKPLVILGDFNIDLLSYNIDPNTDKFVNTMISNSFFPLINKPTNFFRNSSTLIDHAWCNILNEKTLASILDISESTHKPILTVIPTALEHFIDDSAITDRNIRIHNVNDSTIDSFSKDFDNIVSTLNLNDDDIIDKDNARLALFITFSPAEYDWVDAYEYVKNHNLDLPNIESLLPAQLFALDPVLTSTFIRNKFSALLEFIKWSNVLGNIKSYWIRDEYQGRGTCHFHCFLWVEGAPILGKSSDEDIAEFVNSLITCRLPDTYKELSLHNNVLKYQSHKCGKYCKRVIKNKSSGRFTSTCRFSFPRKPSREFVLHDVVSSIVGRHTNNFKKRLYDLPRSSNETWINDYNPDLLLLLWGGNMDIQFVSEYTYSICNYVTKYITKSEKSNIENLEFVSNDESPYRKATKFAYGLLRMRELGAHEAADRILQNSGELWRSSETNLFIPTTFPKYRT